MWKISLWYEWAILTVFCLCLFSIRERDLRNLINQFFAPPLPDPRSGGINTNTANQSVAEPDIDEDNCDDTVGSGEESQDAMQIQLEH